MEGPPLFLVFSGGQITVRIVSSDNMPGIAVHKHPSGRIELLPR
jgi:hypothetical protein